MTSKWDSEFTEEKLQDQILAAKAKHREIQVELLDVEYKDGHIWCYFSEDKSKDTFNFGVESVKCLENMTEEQLSKVETLGTAAIRWEEQDIDLGIQDILVAYQTIHKWLGNLR